MFLLPRDVAVFGRCSCLVQPGTTATFEEPSGVLLLSLAAEGQLTFDAIDWSIQISSMLPGVFSLNATCTAPDLSAFSCQPQSKLPGSHGRMCPKCQIPTSVVVVWLPRSCHGSLSTQPVALASVQC